MPESLFFVIADNGGRMVRASWAVSMFHLGLSGVLGGRRILYETFSHPDPSACMNLATASFLASDVDRMIIIDADHIFQPSDVAMLISHDLPFVSGLYTKKTIEIEWPVQPLGDEKPEDILTVGMPSPVEVKCVPRGFLNVHRSVFEGLWEHVPKYTDENGNKLGIFWQSIPGGMSEDFAFCELYRKNGGKVWLDHRIRVLHEGSAIYPLNHK